MTRHGKKIINSMSSVGSRCLLNREFVTHARCMSALRRLTVYSLTRFVKTRHRSCAT